MKPTLGALVFCLCCAGAPTASLQDEGEQVEATPAQREVEELERQYDEAFAAYREWSRAEDRRGNRELPVRSSQVPAHWEIVKTHPGDPALDRALAFIVDNGESEDQLRAVRMLTREYPESDLLYDALGDLAVSPLALEFLQNASAESSPPRVRGLALYYLAIHMLARIGEAPVWWSTGHRIGVRDRWKGDPATVRRQAEQLLELVRDDEVLAAIETRRFRLGQSVEYDLFELQFLGIGQPAPDIEGEDVDGFPFKLSDYRGKVVFLEFWGNW